MTAPSVSSADTADSTVAEIKEITTGLRRMENRALMEQRVKLSDQKIEHMSKLALGARVGRALDRRMTSQDAIMRPRRKTTSAVPSEATTIAATVEKKDDCDHDGAQTVAPVEPTKDATSRANILNGTNH